MDTSADNSYTPEFLTPDSDGESWQELRANSGLGAIPQEVAAACGMEVQVVTAAIWAVCGQAIGKGMRIDVPTELSPGFNVIFRARCDQPSWLAEFTKLFWEKTVATLREIQKPHTGLNPGSSTGISQPDSLQDPTRLAAAYATWVQETGRQITDAFVAPCLDPAKIVGTLRESPDGSVALRPPASPFAVCWNALPQDQRDNLHELLRLQCPGTPTSRPEHQSGVLSFVWALSPESLPVIWRTLNLRSFPVLVLPGRELPREESSPEFEQVLRKALHTISSICESLLVCRLEAALAEPNLVELDLCHAARIEALRRQAIAWESSADNPFRFNMTWVADLALKIAMLHHLFAGAAEANLTESSVTYGIGFTKAVAVLHLRMLSSVASRAHLIDGPDTVDLTDKETRTYLTIARKEPISANALGRSIHGMTAPERDRILVKLHSRGLIRFEGDNLRCTATSSPQ